MVHSLGLCVFTAEGLGSIPVWTTKTCKLQGAEEEGEKKKTKKTKKTPETLMYARENKHM